MAVRPQKKKKKKKADDPDPTTTEPTPAPAPAAAAAAGPNIDGMSVGELKRALEGLGVNYRDCLEKSVRRHNSLSLSCTLEICGRVKSSRG